MKSLTAAIAFGVVVLVSAVAQAQSDMPPAEPSQVETPASSEAQVPAPSDAPVVEMRRFCSRQGELRYYPQRALERDIEGDVILDCVIEGDRLQACQVVDERPTDAGFGHASLAIACQFRIDETTASTANNQIYERDGVRRVRRTSRWRLNS
jgi:hypothetical protein